MASPFQNAVAVVTGGGGGLGRALCEEMGRRGAVVVVTDLLAETAQAVAAGIVAAAKILRGVERNAAIIVFPFYAKLLWWLYRLHPQIVVDVHRKTAQAFRRRAARSSVSVSTGKAGEK
jgi:NAD(P)-dependent dehydrogenase (short-subunit alcohol dehydrogenase family)